MPSEISEKFAMFQTLLGVTSGTEYESVAGEYYHRQGLGWTNSSTAGGMTISKPFTLSDSLNVSGVTTFGGAFTVSGAAVWTGAQTGVRGAYRGITAASGVDGDSTLAAANSGELIAVTISGDTTSTTITLPATVAGLEYTFFRATATTSTDIRVAPAAADQIIGKGITAADNKAYVSEGHATAARPGDLMTLMGNGTTGWLVIDERGTWARET